MKLFKQLYMLKIILLIGVQMSLFFIKDLKNIFYLLLTFVYLNINDIFIILILLYTR